MLTGGKHRAILAEAGDSEEEIGRTTALPPGFSRGGVVALLELGDTRLEASLLRRRKDSAGHGAARQRSQPSAHETASQLAGAPLVIAASSRFGRLALIRACLCGSALAALGCRWPLSYGLKVPMSRSQNMTYCAKFWLGLRWWVGYGCDSHSVRTPANESHSCDRYSRTHVHSVYMGFFSRFIKLCLTRV